MTSALRELIDVVSVTQGGIFAPMFLNPLAVLEYSMLSSIFVMTSLLSVVDPRYSKRQSACILPVCAALCDMK
jgi:hypothetical protein